MNTNKNGKKTGQFDPQEVETIKHFFATAPNVTTAIKLAAESLGREKSAVQTKWYKDIVKKEESKPLVENKSNLKTGTHYPAKMNGNENRTGESLALQGIRALTVKLGTEERIAAIQALAEA